MRKIPSYTALLGPTHLLTSKKSEKKSCGATYSNLPNNRVGPFNRVGGRFLRN